eukprot:TRINITY_DN65726_c0_g1_i1.p1 TRINITY_DN65726_c0_g1~~TRINITY_DN65726_c0_g1_i1.p1  ORF type:complete len:176 (+),score=41.39 TRINITY_DN65726_c0_g1_i1:60-587(+)
MLKHVLRPCQLYRSGLLRLRRRCATDATPSKSQLQAHAIQSGIPMIGFGIVDCLVMTTVGSTLEALLGASLGISAITAATIGLFCSDSCGVLFGGTIEAAASKMGLPEAAFTDEQRKHSSVTTWGTLGRLLGVELGVCIGATSLLFYKDNKCHKCKANLGTNARFCGMCGAPVAE